MKKSKQPAWLKKGIAMYKKKYDVFGNLRKKKNGIN
jgi:hypothetical protein